MACEPIQTPPTMDECAIRHPNNTVEQARCSDVKLTKCQQDWLRQTTAICAAARTEAIKRGATLTSITFELGGQTTTTTCPRN